MRTWLTRGATALIAIVALSALALLTPFGVRAQSTVLNYFDQANAAGDNALHVTGTFYLGVQKAQYSVTVLTNAQVLALGATPVTLVAAPASGYYVDVIGVTVGAHYVATYTGGSDLKLFWGSRTAGNAASSVITASGLLTSISADATDRVQGTPDGTRPPTTALPLVVEGVSGVNFGGGDPGNTVTVTVEYRVVKTGL
jgi:hypothetical protein